MYGKALIIENQTEMQSLIGEKNKNNGEKGFKLKKKSIYVNLSRQYLLHKVCLSFLLFLA